jgi:hypothetical protein
MTNLYFVLIAFLGMYIGRRIGWTISKNILYDELISHIAIGILCVLWGALIAFLIHLLCKWQHPFIAIRIIFGYALGGYVSNPAYGLIAESSIPQDRMFRHNLIGTVSRTAYLISLFLFEIIYYLILDHYYL